MTEATLPALSEGTLLGGRLIYHQPVDGYRTGIEPVLLAASVPARPGQSVVEAGTGAGAALLALTARVDRLTGLGIENDPAMADIARANLARNAVRGVDILTKDLLTWTAGETYDHAMANPPWHADDGTPSPQPGRHAAKVAAPGLLARWCAALARALNHRGTLTLILPACATVEGVGALAGADCPEITILPLWPRENRSARMVILRGIRHGHGPTRLHPGLVLHEASGTYTTAADRILRDTDSLTI